MRHIADGLDKLFEPGTGDLVQRQSKDNGERETPYKGIHAQKQRVADDAPGIRVGEKVYIVLQPHPVAAHKADKGLKILK